MERVETGWKLFSIGRETSSTWVSREADANNVCLFHLLDSEKVQQWVAQGTTEGKGFERKRLVETLRLK